MKRVNKDIFLGVLLMTAYFAFADNGNTTSAFYYYKDSKVFLEADSGHICLMASPAEDSLKKLFLERVETEVHNDSCHYAICKVNDSADKEKFVKNVTRQFQYVTTAPCYKFQGRVVVPTPYIYINLYPNDDEVIIQELCAKYRLKIYEHSFPQSSWYTLAVPQEKAGETITIANAIRDSGKVNCAEPDFVSQSLLLCSYDPDVLQQWGLFNGFAPGIDIDASSAWNYSTGKGVTIAIYDTGVEKTHPDLAPNIHPLCYDVPTDRPTSYIYADHGTHCAGIAAAVRNNGRFGAGVAPDASIMVVSNYFGLDFPPIVGKIAKGLDWAYQNGADIISNSWGGCTPHLMLDIAIDSVLTRGRGGKGTILVFSAGNTESGQVLYPACSDPRILAVGSLQSNGQRATAMNHGDDLDVVAPGVSIYSTLPEASSGFKSGTSMAAPHVAGIAALILQRNPELTVQQVNDIIEFTTTKVGPLSYGTNSARPNGTWNPEYGYGLVNALNALLATPRDTSE